MSGETISTQELTDLRSEATLWMLDSCDIYRFTLVDDAHGGQTPSEALLQSGVPCAIEPGASQEQLTILAGVQLGTQIFTVFLPAGTDVEVTDHLVVPTQGALHLHVQAVMYPESLEIERRVIATVQGEHIA